MLRHAFLWSVDSLFPDLQLLGLIGDLNIKVLPSAATRERGGPDRPETSGESAADVR